MHDRVSVNPMALRALPVDEEAAALAAIGARRIGVASQKLEAGGWGRGLRALQDAGLEIAYLVHGVFTPVDDDAGWAAESDQLRRAIDAAAAVGAPFVYLCTGPPGPLRWEDAVAALGNRLAPTIDRARAAGIDLALENALSVRTDTSFLFTFARHRRRRPSARHRRLRRPVLLLGRTRPRRHPPRRHRRHPARPGQRPRAPLAGPARPAGARRRRPTVGATARRCPRRRLRRSVRPGAARPADRRRRWCGGRRPGRRLARSGPRPAGARTGG